MNVSGGPVAPTRANTLPELPSRPVPLEELDESEWSRVIATNLTSAFLVCREFAPRMNARRFGRIVNFASIAAHRLRPRRRSLRRRQGRHHRPHQDPCARGGPYNITVNAIAPGFIKTERIAQASWGHDSAEAEAAFLRSLPLKREGRPDDIAGVVAMLCSEAGGYVSGATLDVNGGWYFGP